MLSTITEKNDTAAKPPAAIRPMPHLNQVMITSIKPVIINAEDYKLSEGVEMLRSVAKLSSISMAVPVTFSLVFKK